MSKKREFKEAKYKFNQEYFFSINDKIGRYRVRGIDGKDIRYEIFYYLKEVTGNSGGWYEESKIFEITEIIEL